MTKNPLDEIVEVVYAVNKSAFPDGPWMTEPDRVEWQRAGLPCLIVRTIWGNLTGFVGVTAGHPLYGRSFETVRAEVHGGVEFAASFRGVVGRSASTDEPGDVWWFAFSCGHALDVVPKMLAQTRVAGLADIEEAVYRDVAYVRGEVEKLADWLAEAAHSPAR